MFTREGSDTHFFKDIQEKEERGEVDIGSYARETPIHATTREGINHLLDGGHGVDDDRLLDPENKTIPTGYTYQPVYKEVWKWSGIYQRRVEGCRKDASKIYGTNVE